MATRQSPKLRPRNYKELDKINFGIKNALSDISEENEDYIYIYIYIYRVSGF